MAVANLMRYSTRTVLTGIGLALAIAVVLFVNMIALSFESGASAVYDYIRSTQNGAANVWVTPPSGMTLDQSTGFFTTDATLPESLADQILQASEGIKVTIAPLPDATAPVMIYGRSDRQTVSLNQKALDILDAKPGEALSLNQVTVQVDQTDVIPEVDAAGIIELPLATAQRILRLPSAVHWLMLNSNDVKALRETLIQQNILVTTDPTVKVNSLKANSQSAIAYLLEDKLGRGDMVTFDVKLAAIYFNQPAQRCWAG